MPDHSTYISWAKDSASFPPMPNVFSSLISSLKLSLRKYSRSSWVLARHCKTLFMKQVLLLFLSPVVPLTTTEVDPDGSIKSSVGEEGIEDVGKDDEDPRIP